MDSLLSRFGDTPPTNVVATCFHVDVAQWKHTLGKSCKRSQRREWQPFVSQWMQLSMSNLFSFFLFFILLFTFYGWMSLEICWNSWKENSLEKKLSCQWRNICWVKILIICNIFFFFLFSLHSLFFTYIIFSSNFIEIV